MLAQWHGDTTHYEIFSDSLQLNDTREESNISYLSRTSVVIENATWEFVVNMDFNPSSSNFASVYLVSDKADLSGNAYYVKIGGTTDEVSLYRQDGGSAVEIIDGLDDRVDLNAVTVRIKVTRTNGYWSLYTEVDNLGFEKEGEIYDLAYLKSSYFGVKSTYTKTRAKSFSYSQFYIQGGAFVDNVSPRLDSIVSITQYQCLLYFNEVVKVNSISYNDLSADDVIIEGKEVKTTFSTPFIGNDSSTIEFNVNDTSNNVLQDQVKVYYETFIVDYAEMQASDTLVFQLNKETLSISLSNITLDGKSPLSIMRDNDLWLAVFLNPIAQRTNVELVIENILDSYGDTIQVFIMDISYFTSEFGDVVFNELMPDPNPIVFNLPDAEYIELYNTSDFSINLEDWSFVKAEKPYYFPNYQMEAGEHLLITTTNAFDVFPEQINKIALSSFPTLNNSGMSLQLKSDKGTVIDFVDYDNSWHEDAFKGDGGFSLERIDVYNPSQVDNWTSSCSSNGGTPGVVNCVAGDNPDYDAPYIVNAYAMDNTWIMLDLSEPLLKSELSTLEDYAFSGELTVVAAIPLGDLPMAQQVILGLSAPMTSEIVYNLEVSMLKDMSGNIMEASTHHIANCRLPEASEIVINEIMYAPFSGEAEYVEIYNNTASPFDLSQLKITKQETDGSWENGKLLSDVPQLLLPHSFLALSGDADILRDQYIIDDNAIMSVSSMPSLGNESDNIAILLTNATVIDVLEYSNEWHSILLNDTKGVALERLSVDVETNKPNNWFSASSLANYGTPGAENSQQSNRISSAENILVSPEVFTPDGDGTNDFTTLYVDIKYEGASIRVQVFNHRGIVVKELINNAFITSYSDIRWDGTDNNGKRCPMGSYIVWVEIVTPQGDVITEKLECVVSARIR